jgi:hypothetical protein
VNLPDDQFVLEIKGRLSVVEPKVLTTEGARGSAASQPGESRAIDRQFR